MCRLIIFCTHADSSVTAFNVMLSITRCVSCKEIVMQHDGGHYVQLSFVFKRVLLL